MISYKSCPQINRCAYTHQLAIYVTGNINLISRGHSTVVVTMMTVVDTYDMYRHTHAHTYCISPHPQYSTPVWYYSNANNIEIIVTFIIVVHPRIVPYVTSQLWIL